jgi:Zn-dependent M28 family amino/carboxypeptidase
LADTIASFTLDMVGDGNGTGLLLYDGNETVNKWLSDILVNAALDQGLPFAAEPTGAPPGSSDHVCFADKGIPIVIASTPEFEDHEFYHTPEDDIETLDKKNLDAAASLIWAGLVPLSLGEVGP